MGCRNFIAWNILKNFPFLEKHKEIFIHTEKGKFEYEILGVDLVDPNTPYMN